MNPVKVIILSLLMLVTLPSLWATGYHKSGYEEIIVGKVFTETGQPLEGVTVTEVGTGNITSTDSLGNFTITVKEAASLLEFSSIGYETMRLKASEAETVVLKATSGSLDEVVVIGLGTQTRRDLTGSIVTVGKEAFENRPVVNIGQALQGLVPNLNIGISNGAPNTVPSFNIRGGTSFTTNSSGNFVATNGSPLIMIDGIEASASQLNQINPNDILDLTEIKDASASAIYGTKAAYGVVLVRTKRGSYNQKSKISYSFDASFDKPAAIPDILDAYTIQKASMDRSLWTGGKPGSSDSLRLENIKKYMDNPIPENAWYIESDKLNFVANVNPFEESVRNWTPLQKHSLSMSGGSQNINYYFSLGYLNQEGMYKIQTDKFQRYNVLLNLNARVTDWFNIFTKVSYDQSDYASPYIVGGKGNIWSVMMGSETGKNINMPIKTGPNDPVPDAWTDNILSWLSYGARNKSVTKRTAILVSPELTLLPNKLKLKADLSYIPQTYALNRHSPMMQQVIDNWSLSVQQAEAAENRAYFDNNSTNAYSGYIYVDYNQSFAQKHNLSAVAGYVAEKNDFEQITNTFRGLISPDIQNPDAAVDPTLHTVSRNSYRYTSQAVYGRLSYDYKKRYLLQMNMRYDGSSKFTPNERFVAFPSFSAGWVASDESFMESTKSWLNFLKFTGSWGLLGNQPFDKYPYQPILESDKGSYLINGSQIVVIYPPNLVSPTLTFEKAATLNFRTDATLLSNRLNFSFEWYKRTTKDILTDGSVAYPAVLGAAAPNANAGELETKGFELTLGWKDQIGEDLSYRIGVNLGDYQTKVLSYPGNSAKSLSLLYDGMSVGDIWGYSTGGILQESDFAGKNPINGSYIFTGPYQGKINANLYPGYVWYKDLNGDGKIDNGLNTYDNHGDLRIIGNSTPRFRIGFTGNLQYKNFDLDFLFQGVLKRDVFTNLSAYWGGGAGSWWMYNRSWTPDNTNAEFPMYNSPIQTQDRYLINGAYFRLKQAILGYSLTNKVIERIGLEKVRFTLAGFNIFEFTKIPGVFDPDQISADYPQKRTISIGAQITF